MKFEINDWKQLFLISASHSPLPISLPTIALANPPYCQINSATNKELSRFEMAYKWKEQENGSYVITSKLRNKIEQECLFVEQCLKQVQPGEIVCVLLPNGILSSSQQAYFRRWLLEEMAVLIASIQLPSENFQVECELGIVTSFLILKRKGGNLSVAEDYPIFMAVADKIGFDSRGRRLFRPITKEQENREIDNDLPIIIEEFKQFIKEEIIP
ncbi:N-6 DNA methylase (plasmid) [Okeanomitos corallinicola TIOX110]|uniref:N-6 DNA methylase n=1 Tax=Okeanomitos corallinicola TIOX110 TaxID=3133117 RepID=A0ABZ2UYH2_9CYAN